LSEGASLRVIVERDGVVLHDFQRHGRSDATTVRRLSEDAMGWLQAWADQLSDEQWQKARPVDDK
jgi:hypothetical protein